MDMLPAEARERALTAPRKSDARGAEVEARRTAAVKARPCSCGAASAWRKSINISRMAPCSKRRAEPRSTSMSWSPSKGCTPIHANVRWVKDGRIGLHFGREMLLA
jgi:hypothetical protein